MKKKLFFLLTTTMLSILPNINFGQAPNFGTAVDFVLFSSNGAVSNLGITHLTGNVGTNNGSSTGFGNVDGQMHDNDLVSGQASADLLIGYGELNSAIATLFPGPLLGNGVTLVPGVYSIPSAASLNLELILDGQGDSNALFIFQINGAFSTNPNSKVKLINGAQACNVFWKIEGLVDIATGTTMRGTVVANNSAVLMNVGDTLEGRILVIAGAITVDGIFAYTPIGCGSPTLTGPMAPDLLSTECYGIFSGDGPVSNAGITFVTGDVGTNVGLTTNFDPLNVSGMIHPIPDVSTAAAAADLLTVYTDLNTLAYDIELLYPAQFGNNLVLTPHTYIMNGATTFTDTLYLNAQGNVDAVFVIQINGAMATSTYSRVILTNGTKAENVFWKIDGAVQINDYSIFVGTIVANNAAIELKTGTILNGRAMTTTGALGTVAISTTLPPGCPSIFPPMIVSGPINDTTCVGDNASFTVAATGTGLTYQWRKGTVDLVDGGTILGSTSASLFIGPVVLADYATNYNVVVSGSSPPIATSTNAALVNCNMIGINSLENSDVVSIYPNPFTGFINIRIDGALVNNQVQFIVYNVMGEEVLSSSITNSLTTIETSNLPSGIYIYTVTSNTNIIQTGKLISQ